MWFRNGDAGVLGSGLLESVLSEQLKECNSRKRMAVYETSRRSCPVPAYRIREISKSLLEERRRSPPGTVVLGLRSFPPDL